MSEAILLKVYPNPFCAQADHEGRACGAIKYEPPEDPEYDYASIPYLGCHLIATPKKKGKPGKPAKGVQFVHQVVSSGSPKGADWDHVWEYDTEPVTVPLTPYYRDALRSHGHHGPALLPADEETYAAIFGTKDRFRSPHERLHQYACERNLIPSLKASPAVVEARAAHEAKLIEELALETAAAHAEKRAIKATATQPYKRDPKAEWEDFVGKDVVAKRADWEASEPTHPNFKGSRKPSTSATV